MSLAHLRRPGAGGPPLLAVARAVVPADAEAHVVGGAVRDAALDRPLDDVDVVLVGDVRPVARAVARAAGASCFPLSQAWGAWRVVGAAGAHLDLVPRRGATLEDDLRARDLTVNAVAVPLAGGPVHDPLGGLLDLRARRLRMAAADAFARDPLRVLRAARLAAQLDATIEPATRDAARAAAGGLDAVAGERVLVELVAAVGGVRPAVAAAALEDLGARRALGADADGADRLGRAVALTADPRGALAALRGTRPRAAVHDPADALAPRRGGADLDDAVAAHLHRPLAADLPRGSAVRLLAWAAAPGRARDGLARLRGPGALRRLDADAGRPGTARGADVEATALPGGLPDPADAPATWRWLRGTREAVGAVLLHAAAAPGLGPAAEALLPLALAHVDGPAPAPLVDGRRLLARGVPAGPALGDALEAVRAARYARRAVTEAEAERLALAVAAGRAPDASAAPDAPAASGRRGADGAPATDGAGPEDPGTPR